MKFSSKIVALIIALNVLFTMGVFYISFKGETVPDSLIIAWFAFTTTELWTVAKIKINKVKKGDQKHE